MALLCCPKCNSKTNVQWSCAIDSYVRRRRCCVNCGYTFNTAEIVGLSVNEVKNAAAKIKVVENRVVASNNDLLNLLQLIDKLPLVFTEND